MTKRQVFYSFHYMLDSWRASQVRNIGVVEGNRPATDNAWETVIRQGDNAIKAWIDNQMSYRSCTVVLVGNETAGRKWINYEIIKSWNDGKGIVGVYIHGLKDSFGYTSRKGGNPFDFFIDYGNTVIKLSRIVKCYDPPGWNSNLVYSWISDNLSAAVEEAISIRL